MAATTELTQLLIVRIVRIMDVAQPEVQIERIFSVPSNEID